MLYDVISCNILLYIIKLLSNGMLCFAIIFYIVLCYIIL